ncbi:unnamed protein product [Adineta steineri]|uniref:Uncharacterized protein n=1 Tax=Adineta steineri TaxID=433720 RepID=A0A813R376_9BILA|nr:unnamed protein product [Adineta steineri]CAF0906877.1 unnamed protein product [Adineta steineri]
MSILVKLKNKLQDQSVYETKLREFDECMLLLRNENVELHKRIDQLEALCKTSVVNTQQTHFFDEHVRELEQENGRLFTENQCQREEYIRFLDKLSTMVIRTAVMQENIRKECSSIYHVIEKLSSLTTNSIENKHQYDIIMKETRENLSLQNLNKSLEMICNLEKLIKNDNEVIRSSSNSSSSSSSSSSSTTHCSISTSDSWTIDFKGKKIQNLISDTSINESEQQQILQRSETFIISKLPTSLPITVNNHNVEHCPITRTTVTTSSIIRPSRLPCRRSNPKTPPSNNNNNDSSLSTSKLPIRTTSSLNRQQISTKKSNIPTPITSKIKKDTTEISNYSFNNTTIKNIIQPPSIIQSLSDKTRSYSATPTMTNNTNTSTSSPLSKCTRTTINTIKSNGSIKQMNSTSSESSIEEQQKQMNKLLPIVQDEGYSTWSSVDVKDDAIKINTKKNEINDRQKNIGLVKTWLDDSSNRQCLEKPVKEVENDKLEQFTQDLSDGSLVLCPFVRTRCSSIAPIPLTSTPTKDISLDSLNSPGSKGDTTISSSSSSSTSTSSSSSIFSCSETFEKILAIQTLSNITDDIADTTSSASSTFNMSEYIEDHFIDQDDITSDERSSLETTIFDKSNSYKPQKRLLFPGVLNRLIFFRRFFSESDLQRKQFSMNENENQFHVYHSNTINEHSVEVHLINTYGSDTELHVWSHDCAEQRRFLNERQHYQHLENPIEEKQFNHDDQQLAVERQMLLQQIFEYPWLLQENDLDRTTGLSSINTEQSLLSPADNVIVPSHNPDFYQLCALTNSSSFVLSHDTNIKHTTASTTSSFV